jgi:hypothetical protein
VFPPCIQLTSFNIVFCMIHNHLGHAVAKLVEALRYKPEGRGFNS